MSVVYYLLLLFYIILTFSITIIIFIIMVDIYCGTIVLRVRSNLHS